MGSAAADAMAARSAANAAAANAAAVAVADDPPSHHHAAAGVAVANDPESGGVPASSAVPIGSGPAPLPTELSAEPRLYLYKQFIVALVLMAGASILAAPFTQHGAALLYYLVAFTCVNMVNAAGQALRMISATRRIRAAVMPKKIVNNNKQQQQQQAAGELQLKQLTSSEEDGVDAAAARAKSEAEGARMLRVKDASSTAAAAGAAPPPPPRFRHVFVVPNYREDVGTLRATLDRLASHRHAQHYTVLLAMEAKEAEEAERKAAQLQEQYCPRFKSVLFALHTLNPATEMPGKASNVNSAVRQFAETVPESERALCMLTVMDADALVPEAYVTGVEDAAAAAGAGRELHIYAAPVLFEQNGAAVPTLVRMTDYTWGALAMQNLSNWTGIGFPISNYSLTLHLAASLDFWDTWPDAIGEDMHMFIKAHCKTRGAARLHPIYAPINMAHVNADGFLASCVARYTQAERHMRGIADTAYALREVAGTRSLPVTWRTVALLLACCEAHLVALVSLMSFILMPLFYGLLGVVGAKGVHDHALPRAIIDNLGRANLALMVLILACHEVVRSCCRRHLYGLREPAIPRTVHGAVVHVAGYLWLFLGVYFYTVLPMLMVVLKHLFNVRSTNYVVAAKGGGAPSSAGGATATTTTTTTGGDARPPQQERQPELVLSSSGTKLSAAAANERSAGLPVSVVA